MPTTGVAPVAVVAVVPISGYFFMLPVHLGLRMRMAGQAGKNGIIGQIGMAIGASVPFTRVAPGINREIRCIVVERGARPPGRAVAILTCQRETRRPVVWIGRPVVVVLDRKSVV